jgi:hypothetical protein
MRRKIAVATVNLSQGFTYLGSIKSQPFTLSGFTVDKSNASNNLKFTG